MSKPDIDREHYLNMVASLAKGWAHVAGVDPRSFPPLPDELDEEPVSLPIRSGESPEHVESIPVRVLNAAYALHAAGKPISIRAAYARAGVNRSHFSKAYPDTVKMIRMIAASARDIPRGSKTNGSIEAWEDE